jgi:hypothetical protein
MASAFSNSHSAALFLRQQFLSPVIILLLWGGKIAVPPVVL